MMSNLTNKQIRQIINDAPDGATHWCANDGDNGEYVKQNAAGAFFNFYAEGWEREYHDERFTPTNSLSDLAQIIALREWAAELEVECGAWKTKNAVLADKCGEPDSYKCVVYDLQNAEGKIRDRLVFMGWKPPKENAND
jgi:hypothetical protein